MKFLIYLSWLFFLSEFVLMIVKRSHSETTKKRSDRGSLVLLWVFITLSFMFGFVFANYNVWEQRNYIVFALGLMLVFAGLAIRWMSILQLKKAFTVDVSIGKGHALKTDGMYKLIRHPSYLGLLMIMFGFSIAMNSMVSIIIVFIAMLAAIMYRIYVEEIILTEEFGDIYKDYKAKTKKLIPWIF